MDKSIFALAVELEAVEGRLGAQGHAQPRLGRVLVRAAGEAQEARRRALAEPLPLQDLLPGQLVRGVVYLYINKR